jgi:F-type H+-transporting ATPase subunit b
VVDMKKTLFLLFAMTPVAVFAAGDIGNTDIVPRTVNFLIFAAIAYYLLADKLKVFFSDRTKSIQAELDEVQNTLEESKKKVDEAKAELENAKQIAADLVKEAQADVDSIKAKVAASYENDIAYLSKSFDEKIELETKKSTKEVVSEVLEELMSKDVAVSQDNLTNIILKKVA